MKKILIIEDNADIALQMKKYLTKNGYEVDIAGSFYEADFKINIDIDVALLDINLPDKDGEHLIEKLKEKDMFIVANENGLRFAVCAVSEDKILLDRKRCDC